MLKNLATNDSETYDKIYKEYSVHIKMGTIEDQANKSRLSKLLRFATSNDSEKMTSLAEYVERMKDKQVSLAIHSLHSTRVMFTLLFTFFSLLLAHSLLFYTVASFAGQDLLHGWPNTRGGRGVAVCRASPQEGL